MPSYVALLRGINVGGKNLIRMAELKASFVDAGFEDVVTYIQSGNVVFRSPEANTSKLAGRIERLLAAAFDYEASVVLRTRTQMRGVVQKAPRGFGTDAARFRSDVIFLKAPLTARAAINDVQTREGVDRAWAGSGVLYFERLTSRASQSRLSKVASLPIYDRMTIRNWNTTTKLLTMLDPRSEG
jgi:uncharacterized protein (DUF1697 family)